MNRKAQLEHSPASVLLFFVFVYLPILLMIVSIELYAVNSWLSVSLNTGDLDNAVRDAYIMSILRGNVPLLDRSYQGFINLDTADISKSFSDKDFAARVKGPIFERYYNREWYDFARPLAIVRYDVYSRNHFVVENGKAERVNVDFVRERS